MLWIDQQRANGTDVDVGFSHYFDANLGRLVTPMDPEASSSTPRPDAGAEAGNPPPARNEGAEPDDEYRWCRTDAANGEYFARMHGDGVRFDHRRGSWLLWGGHWWRPDDVAAVRRLAKDAARQRYHEAATIEDRKERRQETDFAIKSEDRYRLEAMLMAARSEPPIADAGDRWDTDPWLLGVANGVVDLRSGILRPGSQADRVTMHVPVAFDPEASCPRWERAIGYSLTGDIREQCLFICFGSGSNGKSIFLRILRALAGGDEAVGMLEMRRQDPTVRHRLSIHPDSVAVRLIPQHPDTTPDPIEVLVRAPVLAGPVGPAVAVFDYDRESDRVLPAATPRADGSFPAYEVSDPRFHQLDAYAVASRATDLVEAELGWVLGWGFRAYNVGHGDCILISWG